MISPGLEAQILRLYHVEKWPVGTIASQLQVHHGVVQRVIEQEGTPRSKVKKPSQVDPFIPFIIETLKKYPRLPASRLYQMVKERGYPGKPDYFRTIVARYRPARHSEAYLRLRTLPGEQAQVDWAHFGKLQHGRAARQLMAFVMVLSYSRALFLRFFLASHLSNFLRGHEGAFLRFAGVPRVILYDNLKSAVLERIGQAIRFNPQFLEFAGYYRFEPRPVSVARGNEKGRVERAIRYARTSFFPARRYKDLEDLNRQAEQWCQGIAMERKWPEDHRLSVREAFLKEKDKLLALPENPYPCDERVEVEVPKSPYVRFDLNDYSVPHDYVGKTLVVSAELDVVRILYQNQVVATHRRSYDKNEQIEDPRHIEGLVEAKQQARKHRGIHLLSQVAPSSSELLAKVAQRGQPLGTSTAQLVELLRSYGADALEEAVKEALRNNAPHPHAVRHILERNRQKEGKPPALPLPLPEDPRVRDLIIKPHRLETYDQIKEEPDDEEPQGEN